MFSLAIRHLLSRRRQTILTLAGIFLGSVGYIFISGFMLGFREFIVDQLVNNDAQIRIFAREESITPEFLNQSLFPYELTHIFWKSPPSGRRDSARIENPQGWYKRLEADPRVEAYSPQLTAQVVLTHAKASVSVSLIGSIAAKQERVTTISKYMLEGKFSEIGYGGNRVLAGDDLLKKLGAHVGENIFVAGGRGAPVPFKIVGSFSVGIKTLDEATLFGSLTDVQKINQTPSVVNQIAVRLFDVELAQEVAQEWARTSREKVQSWDEINGNFLNIFRVQDSIRYMMTACIIVVAGFGIYNILNMVVNQKRKEIAILRSMGFETSDIIFLFFTQGIILGLIGGTLGTLAGYGFSRLLATLPMPGGGPLGKGTGVMLVSFDPVIYEVAFILALVSSAIASILPARTAGRLAPIDVIRGGGE